MFQNVEDLPLTSQPSGGGARLPITTIPQTPSTAAQASVQTALNALPQSLQQHHQSSSNETHKLIIKQQIDGNNDALKLDGSFI